MTFGWLLVEVSELFNLGEMVDQAMAEVGRREADRFRLLSFGPNLPVHDFAATRKRSALAQALAHIVRKAVPAPRGSIDSGDLIQTQRATQRNDI